MDITFKLDSSKFNYRVGCIPMNEDKILLHKSVNDDFWTIVGGRVKINETTEEALKRELLEELGEEIDIDRLICFAENFFTYDNQEFHELLITYLVNFRQGSEITRNNDREFYGLETDKVFIYRWFQSNEISELNIKPSFLKDMILNLPEEQVHIVNKDK